MIVFVSFFLSCMTLFRLLHARASRLWAKNKYIWLTLVVLGALHLFAPDTFQKIVSTPALPQTQTTDSGTWIVTRISDGDTIHVEQKNGVKKTVRLIGIDTPEKNGVREPECYAATASLITQQLLEHQTVRLTTFGTDNFGRTLALVSLMEQPQTSINEILIQTGAAVAWT